MHAGIRQLEERRVTWLRRVGDEETFRSRTRRNRRRGAVSGCGGVASALVFRVWAATAVGALGTEGRLGGSCSAPLLSGAGVLEGKVTSSKNGPVALTQVAPLAVPDVFLSSSASRRRGRVDLR